MDNMTKIKHRIVRYGIILACVLIAILVLFGIHCSDVKEYNDKNRVLDGIYEIQDEIGLSINEGSSWDKKDSLIGEETYKGVIYETTIKNLSDNSLKEWTGKFVIKNDCYINQAWCGSVEIHQFKDGEEIVQKFNDLRTASEDLESSKLDYIIDSTGTWLINLKAGDYLIYYPDSDIGGEYPLDAHTETTIGFIFYTLEDEIDLSSFTINYKLNKGYLEGTNASIYIGAFIIWACFLVGYIAISIIIVQYEKQLQSKEKIIKEALDVFSNFVDAKDPYTHGHSDRVANYSKKIAEKLGMSKEECKSVYYIAALHDIGKCYVPDGILNKPSRLTDEEFSKIKSHTTKGAEMVKNFSSIPNISDGALYHHERYDGKGYPTGTKGEDIPLIARIICVADSFDAMNSDRIYRKKLSKDEIMNELNKGKGTQFDPKIVDAFVEVLKNEDIA